MNTERLTYMLYQGTVAEAVQFVQECKSEEELYAFVYNYNWENGLAVPRSVMTNSACSMEVALLLFFMGDGFTFLSENMAHQESADEWLMFMKQLYTSILNGKYSVGKTAFSVPLTKVQIFKLKKQVESEAQVLFSDLPGVDCNIAL